MSAPRLCATTAAACDERLRLVMTRSVATVDRWGIWRRIAGVVHDADCGQRDRADEGLAAHRECDVHGPVTASGLAELVRAVQRVDDPHAIGGESSGAVASFFRQDRVVRTQLRETFDDEVMGAHVALVHDPP